MKKTLAYIGTDKRTDYAGNIIKRYPNPTLTLQRKISLFSMFFVSETADNQFCVCR